ncbi:hypothetical protein QTP86_015560, partial [Hemibagrus guttatus]
AYNSTPGEERAKADQGEEGCGPRRSWGTTDLTLERLVLTHLRPLGNPSMNPHQFSYQPGRSVEDAVIFLLNRALSHLEKAGSTVRVMFFYFSSAFNTIQPALLRDKLEY